LTGPCPSEQCEIADGVQIVAQCGMVDPREPEEHLWCDSERTRVIEYLSREGLAHGAVGERPAWHIWPHVAIWAIESLQAPGWVGWWAVSGGCPTDYTSCRSERHPRQALRDIGRRWQSGASRWAEGKPADGWSLRSPDQEKDLAPLLAARARMFLGFAADDSIWED
jgi:hypothetical protein